jgi:hypothetical protein
LQLFQHIVAQSLAHMLQETSLKYKPNTENTQSFRRATNLLQFAPEVNKTSQLVRVKVKSKISREKKASLHPVPIPGLRGALTSSHMTK